MFDLRHLKHFLKAAEYGSMSLAGEDLGLTQPTLSTSIRKLEEALGHTLFERTRNGLILTDMGRRFEAHARAILRSVEHAKTDLNETHGNPSGNVRVGIAIGLSELLSIEIIQRVKDCHPNINITIFEESSGQLVDMLKTSAVDLAVSFAENTLSTISQHLVAEDAYYLCGLPEQIEALGTDAFRVADLGSVPLVMMTQANGQRTLVENAARKAGVSLDIVAELNSSSGLKRAMKAGLGLSAFPAPSLYPELGKGELKAIPLVEPAIVRPLFLLSQQHGRHVPRIRAVRTVMVELIDAMVSESGWTGGDHLGLQPNIHLISDNKRTGET